MLIELCWPENICPVKAEKVIEKICSTFSVPLLFRSKVELGNTQIIYFNCVCLNEEIKIHIKGTLCVVAIHTFIRLVQRELLAFKILTEIRIDHKDFVYHASYLELLAEHHKHIILRTVQMIDRSWFLQLPVFSRVRKMLQA